MSLSTHTTELPTETPDRSRRFVSADSRRSVRAKRVYDVFFSFFGLLVLSPLFLLIAVLIKLTDGGDVFYRQVRVGWHGRLFRICKFRTMIVAADQAGPSVTKDGDARITGIGRILRRAKLDELPQLWNVLKGEMSLVGPRPEVPRYVERYTLAQRRILRFKPGITDLASLRFREEEALLGRATQVEQFYLTHCVPRKLKLNEDYAARANLWGDTWLILRTLCPHWIGLLLLQGVILAGAYGLAYALIYDFSPPAKPVGLWLLELAAVLFLQLGGLTWRKQCHGLPSYFGFRELQQICVAIGLATVCLLVLWAVGAAVPPRNVILLDALLACGLLSSWRGLLRLWRERPAEESAPVTPPARIGIIGAGSSGAQLALELVAKRNLGRIPVAFFDDDPEKWQKHIHEIPVVGMPECLLDGWAARLDEAIIVLPAASERRFREISRLLGRTGLKFRTFSSSTLLVAGRPRPQRLRRLRLRRQSKPPSRDDLP